MTKASTLKILALSDTHLEFPKVSDLPDANVLVHAGDWTDIGFRHSKAELQKLELFLTEAREAPSRISVSINHVYLYVVMFMRRLVKRTYVEHKL